MVNVVGKDQQALHRITCSNCTSRLQYTLSEVLKYRGTDYSGGPDGREYIYCPVCRCEVVLRKW